MEKTYRELSLQEVSLVFTEEEEKALLSEESSDGIIGQDRALRALRMGAEIQAPGYNIFVTGNPGTGRTSSVFSVLEDYKKVVPALMDLAYVYNFKRPENPLILYFKPGKARIFKKDLHKLIETLKTSLKEKLEGEEFRLQRDRIVNALEEEENRTLSDFEASLSEKGFAIVHVQEGDSQATDLVPLYRGEQTTFDKLKELSAAGAVPDSYWNSAREQYYRYMDEMKKIFAALRTNRSRMEDKLNRLKMETVKPEVYGEVKSLKKKYKDKKVRDYLDAAAEDVVENLYLFILDHPVADESGNPALIRYGVNILEDRSETRETPVVLETFPNYKNLFGTIENRAEAGGDPRFSFMTIRSGSLVRADGGFLILQAEDLFKEEDLWHHVKRYLKTGRVEIQPEQGPFGSQGPLLKPEPITVAPKLILVGTENLYDFLYNQDSDFQRFFKIPAEFDSEMPRNPEGISQYSRFIKNLIKKEGLLNITPDGLKGVILYGIKLSEQKDKLSTRFSDIKDLLIEADYWARKGGKTSLGPEAIDTALDARRTLFDLPQEKLIEMIESGEMLLQVTGSSIGRVNGLAVQDRGYYSFGCPCLISARTAPGNQGIINIEREVGLSGEIHDKGVFILEGFLRSKYAQLFPLSVYASICFEQSYSEVDGDSASSSEVYALLSSLAEIPLRQDIAVTGSVNQTGEIQPVGGITEKVEGFYRICRKLNFTGLQGVIIPEQNIRNLILPKNIRNDISEGKFHIYPVRTIDEGMSILSGLPAGERTKKGVFSPGSFNFIIERKLKDMADLMKSYGGS